MWTFASSQTLRELLRHPSSCHSWHVADYWILCQSFTIVQGFGSVHQLLPAFSCDDYQKQYLCLQVKAKKTPYVCLVRFLIFFQAIKRKHRNRECLLLQLFDQFLTDSFSKIWVFHHNSNQNLDTCSAILVEVHLKRCLKFPT